MPASVEIVRLAESQFESAAAVMARTFLDDPLFAYFLPDIDTRQDQLRVFMEWGSRYCHRFGEAYTTAGIVAGVALWIPPDGGETTPERLEATGFGRVAEAFGEEAMGRLGTVTNHLEELHHRIVPSAHWYLLGLGVAPPMQGQGIGGHLMQPVLRRADAAGLPCYLETQNERNLPFYGRQGFSVLGETDPPGGGPHLWLMARPAQQADL